MIGLIQRVTHASVSVDNSICGEINQGIMLLLGIQRDDNQDHADRLLEKILNYRIFADSQGKMNLSLRDINGGLLIVSQFTLAADTKKGLRPSFTAAASPQDAEALYNHFTTRAKSIHQDTQCGIFAADMQVSLCNDGPVTFSLQS
ncbi:MAG: D-aminoacyl-tRNA deacylase [Porticoccaceae bacterium]